MGSWAQGTATLDSVETQPYFDDTVRVWLGAPRSSGATVPSLPETLARLLLRLEEHESSRRDQWGCWDYEFSENFRAGRLRIPELDRWLADRRAELSTTVALEPLWPRQHPFAVCLTHDVDLVSASSTPRQIVRYARAGLAGNGAGVLRAVRPAVRVARSLWGVSRAPSTAATLERSIELEAQRGATASYLFTVPPTIGRSRYDCVYAPGDICRFRGAAMTVADLMRTIAAEGFDVGLHGSYAGASREGALAAERATLERATALEVTSTRQHFLHWDIRWTPRLQEEAGLRADSTLGFNRNVGFRAGTSLPFHQFDLGSRRALELLEVPLIVQDGALLGPIGVQEGFRRAIEVVDELFDEVGDVGGALTFLFHPDKLVQDGLALYEHVLDRAIERGAWVTSLRELDVWWRAREVRILDG
jgi:hypothetical protein